jgi:hypothetical protein
MTNEPESKFKNDLEERFAQELKTLFTRRAVLTESLTSTWGTFFESANKLGVIDGTDTCFDYLDTLTGKGMDYLAGVFEGTEYAQIFTGGLGEKVKKYARDPDDKSLTSADRTAVKETLKYVSNIAGVNLERLYISAAKEERLTVQEVEGTFTQAKEQADRYTMENSATSLFDSVRKPGDLEKVFQLYQGGIDENEKPWAEKQDGVYAAFSELQRQGRDYKTAANLIDRLAA